MVGENPNLIPLIDTLIDTPNWAAHLSNPFNVRIR